MLTIDEPKSKKSKPARQHWSHRRFVQGTITVVALVAVLWLCNTLFAPFIANYEKNFGVGGTGMFLLLVAGAFFGTLLLVTGLFRLIHKKHPKKDLTGPPAPYPGAAAPTDH